MKETAYEVYEDEDRVEQSAGGDEPEAIVPSLVLGHDLPTLGYMVTLHTGKIELPHKTATEIVQSHGFAMDIPRPTRKKAMQRGIADWLASRAKKGGQGNTLVRKVDDRSLPSTTWCVIHERVDFADLALELGTEIRISLEKNPAKGQEPAFAVTATKSGSVQEQASASLTDELMPFYRQWIDVVRNDDLSLAIANLLSSLGAVSIRQGGGIYFVPSKRGEELKMLQDMLETLSGGTGFVLAVAVTDEERARKSLARALYDGIMSEIATYKSDLERLEERDAKEVTVKSRLNDYNVLLEHAREFSSVLRGQLTDVEDEIKSVAARCRALVAEELFGEEGEV